MRYSYLVAALCAVLAACSSEPAKKEAAAVVPAKKETAPAVYQVKLDTSKGPVVIEVHRDWAPVGADQFYTLVKTGFYDGDRFFRVVRNFVVQFGLNGDPDTNRLWQTANLPDDPVQQHNARGTITFATAGPNTRTTQVFINLKDNRDMLDSQGFAPFGKVISGMDTVDYLYSAYGDMPPQGAGPDPRQLQTQGNDYLLNNFPRLDYIKKATIQ